MSNADSIYISGDYLEQNPTWHSEDAEWKAGEIFRLLERSRITPKTVCDIGCGSGLVLSSLLKNYPGSKGFGYDRSPQAISLCPTRQDLEFHIGDPPPRRFDIALAIDVFEHVDDYIGFIRKTGALSSNVIFHVPLDLSVQTVLRGTPLAHVRRSVGHLHYFTKETALASIKHAGLEVADWLYTCGHEQAVSKGARLKTRLASLPRQAAFFVNADLAVRVLGGYSLMVLARPDATISGLR